MNLRTYLDGLPRGGIADFANRIGVSQVYLSQLAAEQNQRQASPALCHVIVRESGATVSLRELRRDWQAIWPELADKPSVAAKSQAEQGA